MEAPEGFVVPRSELGWPTGNGFSPIKGDPRFSRITPDKLLARIESASAGGRCNFVGRKEHGFSPSLGSGLQAEGGQSAALFLETK